MGSIAVRKYEILLDELFKFIDCEYKFDGNKCVIKDNRFIPVLSIGGKKFTFDSNDITMNHLLGANGLEYEIPFSYISKDELRTIEIKNLGNIPNFNVTKKLVDEKGKEIESIKFIVEDDTFSFYYNTNNISFCLNIEDKKKFKYYMSLRSRKDGKTSEIFTNYHGNSEITNFSIVRYEIDKETHHLNKFPTAKLEQKKDLEGKKEGGFIAFYENNDEREIVERKKLFDSEFDAYFEDFFCQIKPLANILVMTLNDYVPNLLSVVCRLYPGFKEFLNNISNSNDKKIVVTTFAKYFADSSKRVEEELQLLYAIEDNKNE